MLSHWRRKLHLYISECMPQLEEWLLHPSRDLAISESLPDLNTTTAALLIATWANSFLYVAELIQARYYFRHFKHDDWKLKTLVSVAVLLDTVSTVGDYACVYLAIPGTLPTSIGYVKQHEPQPWNNCNIPAHPATHLHHRRDFCPGPELSSRPILVVYAGVCLLAHRVVPTVCRTQFGDAFTCGVIVAKFSAFKERQKIRIPGMIWLVAEAVVDLSIAAALLWELRKARPTLVDTRSVLDRLVVLTIRTGTATATLAVATVISYLLKEETSIVYTLGRVYVLSMLANLNVRRSGKSASMASGGVSSAGDLATLTIPSIYTGNVDSITRCSVLKADGNRDDGQPSAQETGYYTISTKERRFQEFKLSQSPPPAPPSIDHGLPPSMELPPVPTFTAHFMKYTLRNSHLDPVVRHCGRFNTIPFAAVIVTSTPLLNVESECISSRILVFTNPPCTPQAQPDSKCTQIFDLAIQPDRLNFNLPPSQAGASIYARGH
ncbi:hypothetical protein DFH09DRAFT_1291415 [Mycena vulgaris]|nr:hypothetical protein DFH09DRAFT_1291415 [Mycena vulgaris]